MHLAVYSALRAFGWSGALAWLEQVGHLCTRTKGWPGFSPTAWLFLQAFLPQLSSGRPLLRGIESSFSTRGRWGCAGWYSDCCRVQQGGREVRGIEILLAPVLCIGKAAALGSGVAPRAQVGRNHGLSKKKLVPETGTTWQRGVLASHSACQDQSPALLT